MPKAWFISPNRKSHFDFVSWPNVFLSNLTLLLEHRTVFQISDLNADFSGRAGPHKMARVLALCLDWMSSAAGRGQAGHTKAKTEAAPLITVLERVNGLKIDNQPSTDPVDETSSRIDQPQLTSPSMTTTPQSSQKREYAIAEKMRLYFSHDGLMAECPPRSKVLLVEYNVINMKVGTGPFASFSNWHEHHQILVHYMQKAKQEYVTAANGLEAMQTFQAEPRSFKVIFMGMPVFPLLHVDTNVH